jgi:hypothetical protein
MDAMELLFLECGSKRCFYWGPAHSSNKNGEQPINVAPSE